MSSQTSTVVDLFAERNEKPRPQALSNISAKLYGIPLQAQAKQLASATQGQKPASWLSIGLVLLGHLAVIYLLATQSPREKIKVAPTKTMLASIIAPPSPEPQIIPELVPIIEPPKPEVKPNIKPKKVVEKIKPIENPTERLIEATTEPPKEEEIAPPQAAPVLVAEPAKAPPKADPIEDKFELPRFGVSYLNNPAPDYPSMSRRLGEEGRTLMKVLVSAEGSAEDVQIETSSGFERLDNAAVAAVKKWRFIPAKKNNIPLSAYVLVPMKFSLDN